MGSSVAVLGYLVSLLLCLSLSAGRYLEKRTPYGIAKRRSPRKLGPDLFFRKNGDLPPETFVFEKSAVLTCQAGGAPPPTIHWVKDGHRIEQGPPDMLSNTNDEAFYEDTVDKNGRPLLRRSYTKALLYLDCVTPDMEGDYSCVVDTPTQRLTSTTTLTVDRLVDNSEESCLVKRSFTDKVPARIYLWTSNRVEKSGANIQLFCRAGGNPRPRITWRTPRGEEITESNLGYELLPNGDLLIRDVQWKHMGMFTCIAENDSAIDKKQTFVYPTNEKNRQS